MKIKKMNAKVFAVLLVLSLIIGKMNLPLYAAVGFDVNSITDTDLGDAGDYGVFAKTYEINNDMESNMAVETYARASSHTIGTTDHGIPGNTVTTLYMENLGLPSEGGLNWPAEMTVHDNVDLLVIGDQYDIFNGMNNIPPEYGWPANVDNIWYVALGGTLTAYKLAPNNRILNVVNVSDAGLGFSIDFDTAFSKLVSTSAHIDSYAKANSNLATVYDNDVWDQNAEGLNLVAGLNVVNIDANKLAQNQYVSFAFNNIGLADTVIINVDTSGYAAGTLTIRKNMIGINNWDANAGKVIWNFSGYSGTIYTGVMRGTILAPEANLIVEGSSDGSFIASYVRNNNGELHKNDFTGTIPAGAPDPCEGNTNPVLTLPGEQNRTVDEGDGFTVPEVTASDAESGDLTDEITSGWYSDAAGLNPIAGMTEIDADTDPGDYYIHFSVTDPCGGTDTDYYHVTVVAVAPPVAPVAPIVPNQCEGNTDPVLTLPGEQNRVLVVGSSFSEPVVTAYDTESGDLTSSIIKGWYSDEEGQNLIYLMTGINAATPPGDYYLHFSVKDPCGGSDSGYYRVTVLTEPEPEPEPEPELDPCADNTNPVLSLPGAQNITVIEGDGFTVPTVTASDAESGDLTDSIISGWYLDAAGSSAISGMTGIDSDTDPGTYYIVFSVEDPCGGTDTDYYQVVVEAAAEEEPVLEENEGSEEGGSEEGGTQEITETEEDPCAGNTAPVLTLPGSHIRVYENGSDFSLPSVTANDAEEGDLTARIISNWYSDSSRTIPIAGVSNISGDGAYYLHYDVTDSCGASDSEYYIIIIMSETEDGTAPEIDVTPPQFTKEVEDVEDDEIPEGIIFVPKEDVDDVILVDPPDKGEVEIEDDNDIVYTPDPDFDGEDDFAVIIITDEEEEEIIIDIWEPIPEALPELPNTGGIPVEVWSLTGAVMMGIGVRIKRRSR